MNISVFGTGIVGQVISARLSGLGHRVMIGTRDVAQTLAKKQKDNYGNPSFSEWFEGNREQIALGTYREAAAAAEIIFNCTMGMGSVDALRQAGNVDGKLLVDVSNPLDFSKGMPPILNPGNTDSLGETIQRTFPGLRVVKTLNTMNCFLMVNPALVSGDHNVFVSGNDAAAKQEARNILHEFGWREQQVIDLGDISTARGTEQLLPIWVRLYGVLQNPMFNFHIIVGKPPKS